MTANSVSVSDACLVAGGSSGIGEALVEQLVREGIDVVNFDRSPGTDKSSNVSVSLLDLRNSADVDDAIRELAARGAAISKVAVVAGLAATTGFEELSASAFREQVEANLDLAFHVCSATVRRLPVKSIVLVSSSSAYGGVGASAGYVAAKAGVVGLTRALAIELAPKGMRVNCVVPGPVDTPLFRKLSTPMERRVLSELTPTKRVGQPSEIAAVIRFLLGDDARHITGQTLMVDGGLSLALRPSL
jgi:3-oxoacyl-[acyl-carrier protein] reductase